MRLAGAVGGLIAAAMLLLTMAFAGWSMQHDEREEQTAIEQAWPEWLKRPGGMHGR